nr:aminoglycoside phosphotransferase family protein [Maritalea mediterranea]
MIERQFPGLSHLPVRPVSKQGWDNRTFRLGNNLAVRLPSEAGYAAAVKKEATALAALGPYLPVDIPKVYALGEPSEVYPLPWSIRHWLDGETLENAPPSDRTRFATQLATILIALRTAAPDNALGAGEHSFHRGCHPNIYEDRVIKSLNILNDQVDANACWQIWQITTQSQWLEAPVWIHGDIAVGNILMSKDQITALIDFGTCGVGDPACDYAIAWTYFNADERPHFKETLHIDEDTWHRAKAWALWKALVTLAGLSSPDENGVQAKALAEVLNEAK